MSEDPSSQWQDWIADDTQIDQETSLVEHDEYQIRMELLTEAMAHLKERERDILQKRRLSETPVTLEELSQTYKISRERVRQIEARAFEKIQKTMQENAIKVM